jgi:hypothetical protein
MAKTAIFTTGIISKNHQEKNFSQGKCEFMKFLFLLIDKIKILTLLTIFLPHQLLHIFPDSIAKFLSHIDLNFFQH